MMIRDVPVNESLLILNTPDIIIGMIQTIISPVAPIMIM